MATLTNINKNHGPVYIVDRNQDMYLVGENEDEILILQNYGATTEVAKNTATLTNIDKTAGGGLSNINKH